MRKATAPRTAASPPCYYWRARNEGRERQVLAPNDESYRAYGPNP